MANNTNKKAIVVRINAAAKKYKSKVVGNTFLIIYEGKYINSLRNGVAHSRLDLELEPRHLTDIKFVVELLYVIRLKTLGIDEIIIQKAINQLFHENLAI